MREEDSAREQERLAAAEAARIGGTPAGEPLAGGEKELDEAQRPLAEAGQGEAEGFEQAERGLIENASHGDQHAARRVIEDASGETEDARAAAGGEPDLERSSESDGDPP